MGTVKNRCVIVCASPTSDIDFILSQIRKDDFVMCADGGADKLSGTGIVPDMIIGDLDSSKKYTEFKDTEIIVLNVMKDDTDTFHCASVALDKGYKEFLILGAIGGRLDHTLGNISVLLYLKKHGATGVILDAYSQTSMLNLGTNEITGIKGKTVSVMPYACDSATLTYLGLRFAMDKGTVTADFPYTISNEAESDRVLITLHSGTALLIVSDKKY